MTDLALVLIHVTDLVLVLVLLLVTNLVLGAEQLLGFLRDVNLVGF